MSQDTRRIFFVLLCLTISAGGCNGMASSGAPGQSTPTPIGWRATLEAAWLYEEVCASPCWQGITPGISSEEDAILVLEQLKAKGKIRSYDKSSKYPTYYVSSPIGLTDIEFKEGRVQYMRGLLSYVDYRVWQVIGRFGAPEAVAIKSQAPEDNQSCSWWNDSYRKEPEALIMLAYPSRGSTFIVNSPRYGSICPEMDIGGFYYYPPIFLQEALKIDRNPAFMKYNLSEEDLVPWHGYGSGY